MMELKERLFTDEIKKLMPVLGKETAERLSKAYLIGDETTRKRIVEMLDVVKAAVLSDPQLRDSSLLEPPAMEEKGIVLGDVLYGEKETGPFAIDLDSFMTHVGVFGSSGYGKTNISYQMIKKLSDAGVPVIIFDFSKKNYRDLVQTELGDRISVYTLGSNVAPLKFNPLKPPAGISKTQWAKEFAEIFDHAYFLMGGGRHIVLKALNQLYESNEKPTLQDLKKRIEFYSGSTSRESNWITTSLRPLESLCMHETGEIFELPDGVKPSSFFEKGMVTILEMDALSTNDKTFFIEIMIQWIRDWLVASNQREVLQGVIILEEAHHILNREKSKKIGSETVMDLVFREMRELGLGIVYLDQHPSMVSYPALGNTSTHIYMNLGLDTRYSSDVEDARNMLGIDEEYENFLRTLPPGQAFVLMRNSAWRKPFNAKFPLFQIKKGLVRDVDIATLMKHKIIFDVKENIAEKVNDMQLNIIEVLGSGRGVFTSQLYTQLKLSGTAFKEYMKEMLRAGLVGVREVRVDKTRANYYYLTDAGERILEEKFPKIAEKTKDYPAAPRIEQTFRELGWGFTKLNKEYVVKIEGRSISVVILDKHSRKEIAELINTNTYYICATQEIRNILLQNLAKMANQTEKIKVSVALFENFPQAGFEEYVF